MLIKITLVTGTTETLNVGKFELYDICQQTGWSMDQIQNIEPVIEKPGFIIESDLYDWANDIKYVFPTKHEAMEYLIYFIDYKYKNLGLDWVKEIDLENIGIKKMGVV